MSIVFTKTSGAGADDVQRIGRIRGWNNFSTSDTVVEIGDRSDGSEAEVALRFQLNIHQGEKIENARIKLIGGANDSTTDCNIDIHAEDVANASQLTNSTAFDNAIGNLTTAKVEWHGIEEFIYISGTHYTPDISSIIQEVVDNPSFAYGNYINIIFKYATSSEGHHRSFWTKNYGSGREPELEITIDQTSTLPAVASSNAWQDTWKAKYEDERVATISEDASFGSYDIIYLHISIDGGSTWTTKEASQVMTLNTEYIFKFGGMDETFGLTLNDTNFTSDNFIVAVDTHDSVASVFPSGAGRLKFEKFSFGIHSGSSVQGLEIEVRAKRSYTSGMFGPGTYDFSVYHVKANIIQSGVEPVVSDGAFTNGYSNQRNIQINKERVFGGWDISNYVFLFKETNNDFRTVANGGKVENLNGYDIRFELTDGTKLDHHIEKYDGLTGEVIVWVRIPTLKHGFNTNIKIFYGNSSVSTTEENTTNTFQEFAGVWLFNEAAAPFEDRTSNNNDAVLNNNAFSTEVTGKINKAVEFNKDNFADIAKVNNLALAGDITIMFWLYPIVGVNNGGAIFEQSGGRYRFFPAWRWRMYETSGSFANFLPDASVTDNNWHHVAINVKNLEGTKQMANGEIHDLMAQDALMSVNTGFYFGGSSNSGQTNSARQSHLFIANKSLGEYTIKTYYENQGNLDLFYTLGAEVVANLGTDVNSEYDAEITGSETSSFERNSEIHGFENSVREEDFEIHGFELDSLENDFEISGFELVNSDVNVYLQGFETDSSDIGSEIEGSDAEVYLFNGEIKGFQLDHEDLSGELRGFETDLTDIDVHLRGFELNSDDYSSEIHGFELDTVEHDFEIHGIDTISDEVGVEITGFELDDSEIASEIHGIDTVSDEINVYLEGFELDFESVGSEIHGFEPSNTELDLSVDGFELANTELNLSVDGFELDNIDIDLSVHGFELANTEFDLLVDGFDLADFTRNAEILGGIGSSFEQIVRIHGFELANVENSAEISGFNITNNDTEVELTGSEISDVEIGSEIEGTLISRYERNAEITGNFVNLRTINCEIEGMRSDDWYTKTEVSYQQKESSNWYEKKSKGALSSKD